MALRLRHLCWIITLVCIAGPSQAGPICSGFWDCLPFTIIGLAMKIVPLVALLIFATSGAKWLQRTRQESRSAGILIPFVCICSGILLAPFVAFSVDLAFTEKAHLDRIPFTKLLPYPEPRGFDHVQGYAYWDTYGLEYRKEDSGEYSQLRMKFSETANSPELEACWSLRQCEFVTTTRKGRKIYSTLTSWHGQNVQRAPEYYVDIEGTLVVLSWTRWAERDAHGNGKQSNEFAPSELEPLVDSLERATTFDLLRFPNMSVMGSGGGGVRTPFRSIVIERSATDIEVITRPVDQPCVEIREDGSVVANVHMQLNEFSRPCSP